MKHAVPPDFDACTASIISRPITAATVAEYLENDSPAPLQDDFREPRHALAPTAHSLCPKPPRTTSFPSVCYITSYYTIFFGISQAKKKKIFPSRTFVQWGEKGKATQSKKLCCFLFGTFSFPKEKVQNPFPQLSTLSTRQTRASGRSPRGANRSRRARCRASAFRGSSRPRSRRASYRPQMPAQRAE